MLHKPQDCQKKEEERAKTEGTTGVAAETPKLETPKPKKSLALHVMNTILASDSKESAE
jgi:hypothetical protein